MHLANNGCHEMVAMDSEAVGGHDDDFVVSIHRGKRATESLPSLLSTNKGVQSDPCFLFFWRHSHPGQLVTNDSLKTT